MIKYISYIFAFSFLIACNSNTILKKPDDLIPKDKMVKILTDSYIARGADGVNNADNERGINYLSMIYKMHNIDSITFNQSLKYYTADISLNEEILKLVQKTIDDQLDSLKSAKDSIHNFKVDSLETVHQKIIDERVSSFKKEQEEKQNSTIDSIKKVQEDLFNKRLASLKKKLKDTLNITSDSAKKAHIENINQKITKVNKIKNDSIDLKVKAIKDDYQKIIDDKTKAIKKAEENTIAKKKRDYDRKKYQ